MLSLLIITSIGVMPIVETTVVLLAYKTVGRNYTLFRRLLFVNLASAARIGLCPTSIILLD